VAAAAGLVRATGNLADGGRPALRWPHLHLRSSQTDSRAIAHLQRWRLLRRTNSQRAEISGSARPGQPAGSGWSPGWSRSADGCERPRPAAVAAPGCPGSKVVVGPSPACLQPGIEPGRRCPSPSQKRSIDASGAWARPAPAMARRSRPPFRASNAAPAPWPTVSAGHRCLPVVRHPDVSRPIVCKLVDHAQARVSSRGVLE